MSLVRRRQPAPAQVQVQDHSLAATSAQEQQYVALYEMLYPRLCDFAERFLEHDDARDAVQNAMADIWQRWPIVSIEGPPAVAFFFRAVRNEIAHARRFAHREGSRMARYLSAFARRSAHAMPDAQLEREEFAAIVEATLSAMPAPCREAWALVRENEFTYERAAETMDTAVITAKVRTAKAGKLLREALSDAGYGVTAGKKRLPAKTKEGAP